MMSKITYKKTNEKEEVSDYKSFNINDIKDETILSIFDDKATLLKYLKSLENSVNNYQQQLDTLQDKVKNATQDIVNINGNISSINGNILFLNGDINSIKGNIRAINTDITSINSDITSINADISNLETNVDNSIPMQLWSNDSNFNPNNLTPYNKYEWSKLEEGRFIKATSNNNKINTDENETLPNIKGKVALTTNNSGVAWQDDFAHEGALATEKIDNNYRYTGYTTNTGKGTKITFNANKSNSVYKDNAHVQPNCINLVCWLRGNLRSE